MNGQAEEKEKKRKESKIKEKAKAKKRKRRASKDFFFFFFRQGKQRKAGELLAGPAQMIRDMRCDGCNGMEWREEKREEEGLLVASCYLLL